MNSEQLYERDWALRMLEHTQSILRKEYEHRGQGPLFEQLHRLLTDDDEFSSCHQVAEALGMSQGAVKMAIHRLRLRYRELLCATLTQRLEYTGSTDG